MVDQQPEPLQFPPELQKAIEEFKNRKTYASFDLPTLREIKDQQIEQALMDYIWKKTDANPRNRKSTILGLSRGFQVLYLTWLVEAEVLNGGFNQYYWNTSGEFAELTPAALREIGADEAATIMEWSVEAAISEIPQIAKFRAAGTVEAFSESYKHTKLNDFDEPFSKLAGEFPKLRIRYIRSNEAQFVTQ